VRAGSRWGSWHSWPFLVLGLLLCLGGGTQASEQRDLRETLTTTVADLQRVSVLLSGLASDLETQRGLTRTLQAALAEAEASLKRAEGNLAASEASLSAAAASLELSETQRQALEKALRDLRTEYQRLKDSFTELSGRFSELSNKVLILERGRNAWRIVGLAGIVATTIAVTIAIAK